MGGKGLGSFCGKLAMDFNVYLLQNGPVTNFPEKWKNAKVLDASNGLSGDILNETLGKTTISTDQDTLSLDPIVESENIKIAMIDNPQPDVSLENVSPVALVPEEPNEVSPISQTDFIEDTAGNAQDSTGHNINLRNQSDSSNDPKHKFKEGLAGLRLIWTQKPQNITDDAGINYNFYFDRVSEAYLVPLYELLFERGEALVNQEELFNVIETPSSQIRRAFKYLMGDGVPTDENRA